MPHKIRMKLSASTLTLAMVLLSIPFGLMSASTPALAVEPPPVPPSGNLYGIDMVDANIGWAVGADDRVYKTVNGGYGWTQQAQDQVGFGDNRGVSFGSALQGVVVTDEEYPEMEFTIDAGDLWSTAYAAPAAYPEVVDARDVVMVSPTVGFIAGTAANLGVVYKTINGGASTRPSLRATQHPVIIDPDVGWEYIDVPTDFYGIDFYDTDTGWVVGYRGGTAGGAIQGAAIFRTDDSGSAWTTETATITGTTDYVTQSLYSVAALSGDDAVAVGAVGRIVKRSGGTWTTRTSPVTSDLRDIDFWSATHGVAVGAGGVVRTTDGGDTWYSVFGSGSNLNSVSVMPEGWGLAVGNGGVILRTKDFGASWSSAVDSTKPVTTMSPSSAWRNTDADVVLTATDEAGGSGVVETLYSVDDSALSAYPLSGFSVTTQGVTTVRFRSIDLAGNREDTKTAEIRIDKTDPDTVVVSPKSSYNTATVNISLAPSDSLSGVADTKYSVDGGPEASGTSVAVSGAGSHYIDYHSTDVAGNTESTERFSFKIDLTKPTTTMTAPTSAWRNTDANVVLSASDGSGSGVDETYYTTNGTTPTTSSSVYPDGGFTLSAQGETTVKFRSMDLAGNFEDVKSGVVRIDKADPITEVVGPQTAPYPDPAHIDLAPTDTLSGIAGTWYSVDDGAFALGTAVDVDDPVGGPHHIDYYSRDVAGNQEISRRYDFTIDPSAEDTQAPETGWALDDKWYSDDVTVTLDPNDAGGGEVVATYYSVDGSYPTSLYPDDEGFRVGAEGQTSVKFYSVDNSDNTETVKTKTVKIDKTQPVTTSNAQAYYDDDATVSLSPQDQTGLSGVDETWYILDGGDEEQGTQIDVSGPGEHTIEYWSVDTAGNREDRNTESFHIREDTAFSGGTTGAGIVNTGYNAYYTHSADLKDGSGAALTGKTVYLQYSATGNNNDWHYLSGTATDAGGGRYTYRARTSTKRYYRFVFKGDAEYQLSRGTSATLYPYVYLTRPAGPSTAYRRRTYTWYGYLKPRHRAGATGSVKLYFYRYQSGKWVLRKGPVSAKNYNYSSYTKYRVRTYLPYTGSWKVKAYHRYDSKNASTSSTYKSFRVR